MTPLVRPFGRVINTEALNYRAYRPIVRRVCHLSNKAYFNLGFGLLIDVRSRVLHVYA